MLEEINKEQEAQLDNKLNELLNDPLIKTDEEKQFLKDVAESFKKGEIPIDLILGKSNEAISKLNELKTEHPEFESFVKHHQTNLNNAMAEMMEALKNQSGGGN